MSKGTAQGSPDGPRYIYGKENINWNGPKRASNKITTGDISGDITNDSQEALNIVLEDLNLSKYGDTVKVSSIKDKNYLNLLDHKGKRVDRVSIDHIASLPEDQYDLQLEKMNNYLHYHSDQTKVDHKLAQQDRKYIRKFKETRDKTDHPSRGFNRWGGKVKHREHQLNLSRVDVAYKIFDNQIGDSVKEQTGLNDKALYAAVKGVSLASKQIPDYPIKENVEIKDGEVFYKPDGITLDGFIKASFWTAPQSAYGDGITANVGSSKYSDQMKKRRDEILGGDIYEKANYIKKYGEAMIEQEKQSVINWQWRNERKENGDLTTTQAAEKLLSVTNKDDYRRGIRAIYESYNSEGLDYSKDPYGAEGFKKIINNPHMSDEAFDCLMDNKMFARYGGWTDDHYNAILSSPYASDDIKSKAKRMQEDNSYRDGNARKFVEEDISAQKVIHDNPHFKESLSSVKETRPRGMNSSWRTMKFDPEVVKTVGEGYVMRNYVKLYGAEYNEKTGEVTGYIN